MTQLNLLISIGVDHTVEKCLKRCRGMASCADPNQNAYLIVSDLDLHSLPGKSVSKLGKLMVEG